MRFGINLIKDDVIPYDGRKRILAALLSYLAVSCLVIAAIFYYTTVRFLSLTNYVRDVSGSEESYRRLNPSTGDIAGYAMLLKAKLTKAADRLDAVNNVINKHTAIGDIMYALSYSLPRGSHINNLVYNSASGDLAFDVTIPEGASKTASDVNAIISSWKKDPLLNRQLGGIESVSTKKHKYAGENFITFNFSCRLSGKGL